jgi:hypothetical protein
MNIVKVVSHGATLGRVHTEKAVVTLAGDASNCGLGQLHDCGTVPAFAKLHQAGGPSAKAMADMRDGVYADILALLDGGHIAWGGEAPGYGPDEVYMYRMSDKAQNSEGKWANKPTSIGGFANWLLDKHPEHIRKGMTVTNHNSGNHITEWLVARYPDEVVDD